MIMGDMMTFPASVEEFMEQYKMTDTEHVYSNGTEYVPIYRMKQWFEHCRNQQSPTIDAVPVVRCLECKHHRDKNEHERQYLVEDILICTSPDATEDCWNAVWTDHFCSYGERKKQ